LRGGVSGAIVGRAMTPTIEIAPRFCGPPGSGNGGYVAGRLAAFVEASAVAVRLRRPPPLARPLAVRRADDGTAVLLDGDVTVAEARPAEIDLAPPPAPSHEEAVRASQGFRGHDEHVFPSCFVCGPERAPGDGLRIFPGPLGEGGSFAAPWVPDASLAGADDVVAREFLWAALDCPGAFAFPQPAGRVVLLGELRVALDGAVRVGERCVLTSWHLGSEGRKHFTGSALHGGDGTRRGLALGTWIEVEPETGP
jgi:hypothetical protein